MIIQDLEHTVEDVDVSQVERVLSVRFGRGFNSFWLFHGQDDYPAINILVNGDLASMHYFVAENEAGFQSQGCLTELEKGGFTEFRMAGLDEVQMMPNESVVSIADAIDAAREFAAEAQPPKSVKWLKL